MAGMKGITINTAPEAEPHIYAEDDAAIYQAIFGGDGVSTIGQACKATVLSNNKVRIADGVVCVGGHMARIPYGEYCDCEITNGQSGKNRNDIIVAKFLTTGTGGIDTMTCEVKEGVAGTTATDPALTQDDVYTGGKIRECPLYRVKIEGLSIVAVEQLFDLKPTAEELKELIDETKSNLSDRMDKDYQLAYGTWYANNTVIPLSDSYLNYRDIIVRTGWNNANGGVRDHRLSINRNGTTIYQDIPIYQATKYIGALVVEFNPKSPKQIKIVQSSGLTSANSTNGIRNIFGRTKIS